MKTPVRDLLPCPCGVPLVIVDSIEVPAPPIAGLRGSGHQRHKQFKRDKKLSSPAFDGSVTFFITALSACRVLHFPSAFIRPRKPALKLSAEVGNEQQQLKV